MKYVAEKERNYITYTRLVVNWETIYFKINEVEMLNYSVEEKRNEPNNK